MTLQGFGITVSFATFHGSIRRLHVMTTRDRRPEDSRMMNHMPTETAGQMLKDAGK